MSVRAALALALALLCGLAIPAASPAVARAVDCPDPTSVAFADMWRLWRADAKRGDGRGSGGWAAARRCFGSAPFTIRAYVGISAGIGGTSPTGVSPGYWVWSNLILFGTSRTRYGFTTGNYLGIVVPDSWGNLQRHYQHAWVDVRVRFNHPLSRECVGYGPKKLGRPTKKEAVAFCRRQPVILSIARAGALPATDTAGTAASCPEIPATVGSPMDVNAYRGPLARRYPPAVGAPEGAPGREVPDVGILVLLLAGTAGGAMGWRRRRRPACSSTAR